MMGMIVVMVSASRQGQKNAPYSPKWNVFTGEKLQYRGVFRYPHRVSQYLHAKVEIAEAPRHTSGLFQCCNRNFQHLLRHLFQDVMLGAIDKEVRAVSQRFFEIETKLPAIFGDATPTPLSKGHAIGKQPYMVMMSVRPVMMGNFLDESQFGHKYFRGIKTESTAEPSAESWPVHNEVPDHRL